MNRMIGRRTINAVLMIVVLLIIWQILHRFDWPTGSCWQDSSRPNLMYHDRKYDHAHDASHIRLARSQDRCSRGLRFPRFI